MEQQQQQQQQRDGSGDVLNKTEVVGLMEGYASPASFTSSFQDGSNGFNRDNGLIEGVQLERFLHLYKEVLKHTDYYTNLDGNGDDDDKEMEKDKKKDKADDDEDKPSNKFLSLRSSIPMSHSNALLHMRQILWKNPVSFLPDRMQDSSSSTSTTTSSASTAPSSTQSKEDGASPAPRSDSDASSPVSQQALDTIKSSELFFQFLFGLLGDKSDVIRQRGFQLLQDYFHNVKPGSLYSFSAQLIKTSVDLLINIIQHSNNNDLEHLVASSALVSLVIGRNHPTLTLNIVKFILTSKYQSFLPANLKKYDESYLPLERFDFRQSIVFESKDKAAEVTTVYSMATNGPFVFVHCNLGLLKLALTNSQQYTVVQWKKDYHTRPCTADDDGEGSSSSSTAAAHSSSSSSSASKSWIIIFDDTIYFRSLDMSTGFIAQLNISSFEETYVSVERGDVALGARPYTLFADAQAQRIGVIEMVEDQSSVFPQTRLRYLRLSDEGHFEQDGVSVPINLYNTTNTLQPINASIISEKEDPKIIAALTSFQIAKIYSSARGGLFFLTKDNNLFFIGKNDILTAESEPLLLSFSDQTKKVSKVISIDPVLLVIDDSGLFHKLAPISSSNAANFSELGLAKTESDDKKTDQIFVGGVLVNKDLYALNDAGNVIKYPGMAPTTGHAKITEDLKIKSIAATESGFDDDAITPKVYLVKESGEAVSLDSLDSPEPLSDITGNTLHLQAAYSSVFVVTDTGIYAKGNNLFGQLGTGHYKNTKEFTKITAPFDTSAVTKIEIGLTYIVVMARVGLSNQLYYSGNIKGLKQVCNFTLYAGFGEVDTLHEREEMIMDVSGGEYGFIVLKQTINTNAKTLRKSLPSVKAISDERGFLGVFLPGNAYQLYHNGTKSLDLVTASTINPTPRPFHLSKNSSFEFDTATQRLIFIANQERPSVPFNPRVQLVSPRDKVDNLVLVNALLDALDQDGKPSHRVIKVPSPQTDYIKSKPKITFTIAKQQMKEGKMMRVSTSFLRVDRPVLLWGLVLPSLKENTEVNVVIESGDGTQRHNQKFVTTDPKLDLDQAFELRTGIQYKFNIFSNNIKFVLPSTAYTIINVSNVNFDFRTPVEYSQVSQMLYGLSFTELSSASMTFVSPALPEVTLTHDATLDLFDSVETMWDQFAGSISMNRSLQNGAKDKVNDVLSYLEQPLTRALSLLGRNIKTLLEDPVNCSRVIGFIHSTFRHESLFKHVASDHAFFLSVMKQMNKLFCQSFTMVYNTPNLQVSAIHMLYFLIKYGGATELDGAPYILTALLQSMFELDVKSLLSIPVEDDAFSRENIDPALVYFYDHVQTIIYRCKTSNKKLGKQKAQASDDILPLFSEVLMSICSDRPQQLITDALSAEPSSNNQLLDDYKSKSIELIKKIWSSSLITKSEEQNAHQPKVFNVSRFNSVSSSWSYDEMVDAISFKTDREIYVTGVGLYGDKGTYTAKVGFTPGLNAPMMYQTATTWTNKTNKHIQRIDFTEPFQLRAGDYVSIYTKISGPSSSSGYKGKDSVNAEGVNFKFSTTHITNGTDNGTSVQSGQIPVIYFQFETSPKTTDINNNMIEGTREVSKMVLDRSLVILRELFNSCQHLAQFDNTPLQQSIKNDYFLQSLLPFIVDSYANTGKAEEAPARMKRLLEFLECTTKINHAFQPRHPAALPYEGKHTIKMESSHPYEECAKQTNIVEFPKSVKWMVIQFDPRSITSQQTDKLQIWLNGEYNSTITKNGFSMKNYPATAFIVPGNRLIFDFQTASNPQNIAIDRFGYMANITGYEVIDMDDDYPLSKLERQVSFYIAQISSRQFFENIQVAAQPAAKKGKKDDDKKEEKAKKAKVPKKARARRNGWDEDESDSEKSSDEDKVVDAEEKEDEVDDEEDSINNIDKFEEELDISNIKVDHAAPSEKSVQVQRSEKLFSIVWGKVADQLEANPKHSYGVSNPLLLDFINEKSGTVGDELSTFFKTVGMELFGKPQNAADAKDAKKDDKKKDKKDKKAEHKDKDDKKDKAKNKDKEDANKDENNNNNNADAKDADKAESKQKKIEEKFKDFPISIDDLQSIGDKLRLRRLALLVRRKKRMAKFIKEQKANNKNDNDDSDEDEYSDSSDSESDSESSEPEEGELSAGSDWDDSMLTDDDEKKTDNEASSSSVIPEDAAKPAEEKVKVSEVPEKEEDDGEDDGEDDEDDDDKPEPSADIDVAEKVEDEAKNDDKDEEDVPVDAAQLPASNLKENISTYIDYVGWSIITKKLFVEILRLNNAESDFATVINTLKNQKKSFADCKENDQFKPYLELWRNIQRRLNKWSLRQVVDFEEFDGLMGMFGDEPFETSESDSRKKVLPIEKFDYLFDFIATLAPASRAGSSGSSSSQPAASDAGGSSSSPSDSVGRSLNYSFEDFMHSSNINTSTYNLLQYKSNKKASSSAGSGKGDAENGVVNRSPISVGLLSLFLDEFTKINFQEIIETTNAKNQSKIDSIKMWSRLIEMIQVPSALENVVWMMATTLHSNQASKDLLPADWQGSVAQNLAVSSCINHRYRKEFIQHFHTLLETLSKRIKHGHYSDAIILNALSCFSIHLLPEDIAFVQTSEIFPLISKILSELHSNDNKSIPSTPKSKGKERLSPQELELIEHSSTSLSIASSPNVFDNTSDIVVPVQNSSFVNIANKCKVVLSKSPEMMASLFDDSTLSFWEASQKGTITVTIEKVTPVQEICLYIDNTDAEYLIFTVKIRAGLNSSHSDITKVHEIGHNFVGWKVIPLEGALVSNILISFTGFESIRVRQLKIMVPDKQELLPVAPSAKFDATLALLKLLTFQIFGINANVNNNISKDLKNQVVGLLSSTGVSKIQKQIFSLISSEVQKEIQHLEGIGWQTIKEMPKKDSYLYELLTTLSTLLESEEGKSFIPSKSSIFALLPLIHKGADRIQHLCINICKRMLVNLKPALFAEFIQDLPTASQAISSFAQYLLLVIAKPINVQVKGASNTLKQVYTIDTMIPSMVEGDFPLENGKELLVLVKELISKSESWRQVMETEIVNCILSMRNAATMPVNTYLVTPTFWAALSGLLIAFDNQKIVTSINSSNINSESKIKTCQNHDDGVTEAQSTCSICQMNLCQECDRVIHMPKSKRDHQRSPLLNDVITIEIHESCVRLKLSTTLFVLDNEKQKAIIQTINLSSSETCRFCHSKLDLENLIPKHGISNVCSNADCREKAPRNCTKVHPCGHYCYGVRDEEECLPCLHGCKRPENAAPLTRNFKVTQDADDFCLVCWTECLSEAPSIQLDCGHVFHHTCIKHLLEARWVGARITLRFSKCPICKVSIQHPTLKALTSVIEHIGSEIIRKGKLRIDFLGIQKDPMLLPGGSYENNMEGYIMEQFAYYLCFKCKQPYFGGSNQCAANMASPEKFNPEELICGGCSSDDVLPICPKHGKDYLEFKCRYCCSVAIWYCFGTHHFCETCHNKHTELTSRSSHPPCPVGPGGIELPGDECPLHIEHAKTGTEFALGCGICRNVREF
ncbi:hypothetical protein SAMD00019534_040580 [Acytostelium subglobosum LB1]|uniref:hypothetical protein n=1 Tax=Acytostelium subglobosum LB1 TaxID=1410327 RepID=UPI000645234A|nr:hypothetical protein SAMD00019534_040580 [Acytostelium subglobosum LB1]GAM20883.1 hypothetical protein SAMD00019534_040580 [Acytostelium subglobosum LB1]|eukprot:XP_012756017.1 hypothetical protein SAMD00019534_040580 [Acytostelium subglobosum LB1]